MWRVGSSNDEIAHGLLDFGIPEQTHVTAVAEDAHDLQIARMTLQISQRRHILIIEDVVVRRTQEHHGGVFNDLHRFAEAVLFGQLFGGQSTVDQPLVFGKVVA